FGRAELERFFRCDLADKSANWQSVSFAAQHSGYINLSDARVYKLSDADFPWFMGWTKVSEGAGALSDDGLCDSKVILDLLQEANGVDGPKAGASLDRLALYLRDHEEVRQKLRGLICEAPTEWDKSTNHKRFDRLTQAGEHYEGNPEGLDEFLQFVEKFQFWDTTGLPTKVWHFHPLKFIGQFKKCGWLDNRDFELIYPDTYTRETSQKTETALRALSNTVRERYRHILNKAMNKHLVLSPARMAHFLGQGAEESRTLTWMDERRSEESCNKLYGGKNGNDLRGDGYKFRGRGLKQLTGKYNYAEYWTYRGWIKRNVDFQDSWWDNKKATAPTIDNPSLILSDDFATIDVGAWYWEATPNRGLPHSQSTLNMVADRGRVDLSSVQSVTKNINGAITAIENREYHTRRIYKIIGDEE
ncbi:glycoside hydrolase family 19 protein, partial [Burkholderia sp. Leaf177]|uniref:glycoside hydrolase family 19 protein n=1 Tax=Burkholderia sp. Leaf177 TaxID=1736287 RepID=UPI000A8E9F80